MRTQHTLLLSTQRGKEITVKMTTYPSPVRKVASSPPPRLRAKISEDWTGRLALSSDLLLLIPGRGLAGATRELRQTRLCRANFTLRLVRSYRKNGYGTRWYRASS